MKMVLPPTVQLERRMRAAKVRTTNDLDLFKAGTILRWLADSSDIYNGRPETMHVVERCGLCILPLGVLARFTRDSGMHSSGWWKNPDYERCYHLSLSFHDPESGQSIGQKQANLSREMVYATFGGDRARMLWCEPPFSDDGKRLAVWHYRLFMEPDWKTPLLPRGEVYTREFIESGWKSWSDVQADMQTLNLGDEIPEVGGAA